MLNLLQISRIHASSEADFLQIIIKQTINFAIAEEKFLFSFSEIYTPLNITMV